MTVYFRDEIGLVQVDLGTKMISFMDGYAYFDDGDKEYRILVSQIVEISQ